MACVGSSTTASRGTYRWIAELESRPQNGRFRFVNLGVGGDLSFDVVRRLRRVIEIRPDRVIVLIGTNDILVSVFPNFRRVVRVWKGLPYDRFSFRSFYRDYLVREKILRRSFDEISEINGWEFHIDGVHLNTRGGRILSDAVQRFLDSPGAAR